MLPDEVADCVAPGLGKMSEEAFRLSVDQSIDQKVRIIAGQFEIDTFQQVSGTARQARTPRRMIANLVVREFRPRASPRSVATETGYGREIGLL